MSRVEPKERPSAPREAKEARQPRKTPPMGHTPGKAEGEERDVEKALRKQERRR